MSEEKTIDFQINCYAIAGQPHIYSMLPVNATYPIAFAAVNEVDRNHAQLWYIYTKPAYRKKGLATQLLDRMKERYKFIYTHAISDEGRSLCIKSGFRPKPDGLKEIEEFEWKKEVSNAIQTGKS